MNRLNETVPLSKIGSHSNWPKYLYSVGNKKGLRILEIGSRGHASTEYRYNLKNAEFVGFDYYEGINVDVVGDVHKLSSYFKPEEQFDVIFSSACMEHFAMPWIAAIEIAKMLKVGGHLIIETHFAYSSHSRPWHFFHFTDQALKCLFNELLGFKCIEAGMCNPITAVFSNEADEYLRNKKIERIYCHSNYIGIKVRDIKDFRWEDVSTDDLVTGKYPLP